MSSIRLYVDEDAEQGVLVAGLRARQVDVVTAMEAGMIGRTDRDQLESACQQDRAIYSLNARDFARLHREYMDAGRTHSGIILIPRQRYTVGEKVRRLTGLLLSKSAEEMRNQITFL